MTSAGIANDEDDNVEHTNQDFPRLDAVKALEAIRRALRKELALTGQPLRSS